MKKSLRKKAIIVALAVSLCIPTVCTAQTPALVAEAAVVAPTGISIEAENGSATISWDAVSGAKTYALFMKDAAGNVTLVHNRITGTSYSFSGLKDGARYGFVLKAYTSAGWSGYSSTVWTTCNVVSKAPENVTVVPGDGEVTVSWSPSYAAQTYALFLKDTSGNVTLIHNRVNGTSYTVKGMKNGVRMGFVVKAYVNREWSSWSKVAWATPTEAKKVPENLKANVGNDKITLTWDSVQQAEKYAVYQKSRSGAVTLLNSNVKGNNYDITGFAKNEEIGFVVKAYVNGTWEGYSEVVWVTVTAASPTPIPKPTVTPVPIFGDDYRIDGDTLTLFGDGELGITLSDGTKIWELARDNSIKKIIVEEGITSIGDNAFNSCMDVVSIKLPKKLKCIERNAFSYCQSLTDISIPNGVQEIGERAFYECSSLKEIEIPEGIISLNNVFHWCENLEYVKLPESVTSLEGAFYRCKKLSEIVLPKNVKYLKDAFYKCSSLRTIDLPESVESLSGTFEGCTSLEFIEIPTRLRTLNATFRDCTSLKSVVVPEGVIELNNTFEGCSRLEEVILPGGIESMTETFVDCTSLKKIKLPHVLQEMHGTFRGCINLTEIDIPARVKEITDGAFEDCQKIEHIVYPIGVTKGDLTVFNGCSSLKSITFTNYITGFSWSGKIFQGCDSLENIYAPKDSRAYNFFKEKGYVVENVSTEGVVYKISGTKLTFSGQGVVEQVMRNGMSIDQIVQDNSITEVVFGDGITAIGDCAFWQGCGTVKRLSFSNSIVSIEENAFNSCTGLTQVTIPSSVKKIEVGAFYNCTSLKNVTLPNGLEYLGNGVFGKCTSLKTIALPTSLRYLGPEAFIECSALESIILPNGLSEICEGTFEDCISLTSVSIPQNIRTIDEVAFSGCESLEEILIPEGVTTIKDWAFSSCYELRYVTFPSSLTSIGEYVFDECDSLDTLFVPEDSYAELWAVWNDFEFEFIDGDDDDDDSDDGNIGEDDDDGDDGNTGDDDDDRVVIVDDSDSWNFKGILLYAQNGIYPSYTDAQVKKLATELGSCAYIINAGEISNWTCGSNTKLVREEHINTLASENMRAEYLKYLSDPNYDMLYDYADSAVSLAKRIISYNEDARIYFTLPSMKYLALASCYEDAYCTLIEYLEDEMGQTLWRDNVEGFYFGTEDAVEQWYINFDKNVQRDFEAQTLKVVKNIDNKYFCNVKNLLWIPFIGVDSASSTRLERIAYVADYSALFDYIVIQSGAPFGMRNGTNTVDERLELAQLIVNSSLKNRMYGRNGSFICPGKLYDTEIGFELEYSPVDKEWNTNVSMDAYEECLDMIGSAKGQFPIVYYMGGPTEFDAAFEGVKDYLVNESDREDESSVGEDEDADPDISDDEKDDVEAGIGEIAFNNSYEEKMSANAFKLSWSSDLSSQQKKNVAYTVIQAYRKNPNGTSSMAFDKQISSLYTSYNMNLSGGLYGIEVSYYDANFQRIATGQTRVKTPVTISDFKISNVTEGQISHLYGNVTAGDSLTKLSCTIKDQATNNVEVSVDISLSDDIQRYLLCGSELDNNVLVDTLKAGTKIAEVSATESDGTSVKASTIFVVSEKSSEGSSDGNSSSGGSESFGGDSSSGGTTVPIKVKYDDVYKAFAFSRITYIPGYTSELSNLVNEMWQNSATVKDLLDRMSSFMVDEYLNGKDGGFDTYKYLADTVGDCRIIAYENKPETGFSAMAFLDESSNQVIIAYCGTQEGEDIETDIEFAVSNAFGEQFEQALEFYEGIKSEHSTYEIMVTGHSLGGALATFICALTNEETITVNGANGIALNNIMTELYGNSGKYFYEYPNANAYTRIPSEWECTNYLTSNAPCLTSNLVQAGMNLLNNQFHSFQTDLLKGYIGQYKGNALAKDAHNIFSFMHYDEAKNRFYIDLVDENLAYGTDKKLSEYDVGNWGMLYYCTNGAVIDMVDVHHHDFVTIGSNSAGIVSISQLPSAWMTNEVLVFVDNSEVEIYFEGLETLFSNNQVIIVILDSCTVNLSSQSDEQHILEVIAGRKSSKIYISNADYKIYDTNGLVYENQIY